MVADDVVGDGRVYGTAVVVDVWVEKCGCGICWWGAGGAGRTSLGITKMKYHL